jgi:hypothetical protein
VIYTILVTQENTDDGLLARYMIDLAQLLERRVVPIVVFD